MTAVALPESLVSVAPKTVQTADLKALEQVQTSI